MTLPYNDVINMSKWMTKKYQLIRKVPSASKRKVLRGQVYWCEFGENVGSEQCLRRPALILSNNPSNKTSPNVIVAPITNTASNNGSVFPLNRGQGSPLTGNVLLANIKTISKARLGDHIDDLDDKTEMPGVEDALFNSLGIASRFNKLEKQLQSTNNHLKNVKNARNTAQDGIKEIAKALKLKEDATIQEILKKIQSASK